MIKAAGECNNGVFTCYVREPDISDVQIGMEITVESVAPIAFVWN